MRCDMPHPLRVVTYAAVMAHTNCLDKRARARARSFRNTAETGDRARLVVSFFPRFAYASLSIRSPGNARYLCHTLSPFRFFPSCSFCTSPSPWRRITRNALRNRACRCPMRRAADREPARDRRACDGEINVVRGDSPLQLSIIN